MNQQKIGNTIKEKRENKKLTQTKLADILGVTNRTIINWEKGKCLPDYSILLPLCNELDISISELLTGEKEIKTKTTIELIIKYLDRNRNENIKECRRIGKILLIGGIFLSIFSLIFIKPYSIGFNIFPIIGMLFAIWGFSYMTKRNNFKKRTLLKIIFIIIYITFLIGYDIYDILINNTVPRYYTGGLTETNFSYYETPLFDAYICLDKDRKFHIIPIEIKYRKEFYSEEAETTITYMPNKEYYCGK